jgi:uncharacterized membrane protein HdeD (DUF308 family)
MVGGTLREKIVHEGDSQDLRTRSLRWLALVMGVACVVIGLVHLLWGISSVPGEESAGATVDSRERFYNAIFAGYGVAWIWAACRPDHSHSVIRWLAGIFLLGGVARLLSRAVWGQPHWFQVVLTAIELALPAVLVWLSRGAARKAPQHRTPSS